MELTVSVEKDDCTITRTSPISGTIDVKNGEDTERSGFLTEPAEPGTDGGRGGFCSKLMADKDLRHKCLHTGCVGLALMASGWRMSMTGPVLPDLRLIINENLSRASWIISAIALGGLFGSLCGGIMYDRLNKYVVFIVLTLTLAVGSIVTPWCSTFGSMVAIHVLNGACAWGIDTVAAADVVLIWRVDSAPFIQAVNFAYSLGAMISPVAAEPFLAKRQRISPLTTNATDMLVPTVSSINDTMINELSISTFSVALGTGLNATYTEADIISNITNTIEKSMDNELVYGKTHVHFAFLIAGMVSLFACMTFILQWCCLGRVYNLQSKRSVKTTTTVHYPLSKNWRIVYVVILSCMVATYCTSERLFYSYLMTYLIGRLHWDKTAGASATTVFWIAFTVGRLVSVFVVRKLNITVVFVVFLGILIAGQGAMLVAVRMDSSVLVWVSCGLHGLGMSALFGSSINWISSRVCPYTGTVSSIMFAIVIVGAIVYPLIVGNIMSSVSYDWFIYLEIILTCFMVLILIFAEVLYFFLKERKTNKK